MRQDDPLPYLSSLGGELLRLRWPSLGEEPRDDLLEELLEELPELRRELETEPLDSLPDSSEECPDWRR